MEGQESRARWLGHQGSSPLILPYHPAFYRGLYRNKHANTSGQSGAFTKFPSQAAAPRPLFCPPPPNLQAQPPISADSGWREPGIQLLFSRERHPLLRPRRRGAGVELPQRPPLPRRPGLRAPAAPGGASRAVEGRAEPPRGLFVLPRAALRPRRRRRPG